MIYILYNTILAAASLVLIPYYGIKILITGKYRKSLGPKLGKISEKTIGTLKGSPRIWVHAVSVGEVAAAAPIISSLRRNIPDACIVLSTSTETGQEMARRIAVTATALIYYPLDIPFIVRRVLNMVKPDIFVAVETEIWPNFIRICREKKVRIAMVNGRISPRSFRRYRRTRFFWKKLLGLIDEIGVISPTDAQRLEAMGMDPARITVMGNAKYDSLAARTNRFLKRETAERLNIGPESKVFLAASTHAGEEEIVIGTYKKLRAKYPDMILIIVPRHPERGEEVRTLLIREGFSDIITTTEIKRGKRREEERIIVIDVIGELFKVYSMATVVFCGGSLVPRGGQNILEAAAWGTVVLYGPSMDDFIEERELLENVGAGITVKNGRELSNRILTLLSNSTELEERGNRGREAVLANRGASKKYADMIENTLDIE